MQVRSRLLLLIGIPAFAVAVIAFCVTHIADVANGAQVNSPDGSVRDSAILSALAVGVAMIIVVALASLFTIVVARSVLQPLHRLQAGASELTGARLADTVRRAGENKDRKYGAPFDLAPIDVDSSDEIGGIARAFDEMRREFLRLAVGEAALHARLNTMFANLSHRGQSLMERQMRLVQHLEQGEQDAQRLATLSRVDRISNRMHRHSENLLVLVGYEPSGGWNQPVTLADVISAAVSEIEEYQRVSLKTQPDVAIVGPAVADVIHLVVELTENATSFSAADMQVDVSSRALTTGGLLLDITDRGVGMTPRELAYANWRLENPPTADTDVPRCLGLFVVARLAARHGVRVRLQAAEFGGLTALVWLPDEILTQQSALAATRTSGFASAGSTRGLHEAVVHPGYATAERRVTTARSAPPGDVRGAPPDQRSISATGLQQAEPWSPSDTRSALRAGSAAIIGSPGSELPDPLDEHAAVSDQPDPDVGNVPAGGITGGNLRAAPDSIMPGSGPTVSPAGDITEQRKLPIFDAVESHWFSGGRGAPSSSDRTAAPDSRWSSPADAGWRAADVADSPSSGGSTAAGLPRRQPKANLVPGAIPSAAPIAPNRSAAATRERLAGFQRGVDEGRAAVRQGASPGEDEDAQ